MTHPGSRTAERYRPGTHQRGEETRRRILEAAIEAFARDGYDGVSTRALAKRAEVNLPALQYYFGSKEGLHRAAIAHINQCFIERMTPLSERARQALAAGDLSRPEALALLQELLHGFAGLVLQETSHDSRALFITRAEIEHAARLEPLHDSVASLLIQPCAALIGCLSDRPAGDEATLLQTLSLIGQVKILGYRGARRILGWTEVGATQVASIQSLIRRQTAALFAKSDEVHA